MSKLRTFSLSVLVWLLAMPIGAQETLSHAALEDYIADLKARISRAGSNLFVEPPVGDLETFVPCLQNLLMGDVAGAVPCLAALNFDVDYLDDSNYGKTYVVVEERPDAFKGLGTYITDPAYQRNIVICVPHPLYDLNTLEEGQRIFQEVGARALFVAGTHRCANPALSPCSGTTSACGGGPYRISDAAHFDRNFLHTAHEATLGLVPPPRAFNLHGQSSEPQDVILSDGTRNPAPAGADVNRLRDSLLARGIRAGSCNWSEDAVVRLCGTTNTAGRLYNNSQEPCSTGAVAASGLFLHLEQKKKIRNNPSALIATIKEVFPVDGVPLPPAELTTTAKDAAVDLAWTASPGATSYDVHRSAADGGPYTTIASDLTSADHTDTDLVNGVTYYYVVTAVNLAGESAASGQASATPAATSPPQAPAGLAAKAGKRKVRLTWQALDGADSYNVKRGPTTGGPYTTIAAGVLAASYTDTGLQSRKTYYYVVTAVKDGEESPHSNEAAATAR